MSSQFDQGIERAEKDFRESCWAVAVQKTSEEWKTFQFAIMQAKLGGVSSQAEAQRLFNAEQIGSKLFFTSQLPSILANDLLREIQEGFQNISRPVSSSKNEEEQTVEILNYYFPTEEKLKNFELALSGELDGIGLNKNNSQSFEQIKNEHELSDLNFEESKLTEEPKEFTEQITEKINETEKSYSKQVAQEEVLQPSFGISDERKKVKEYIESGNSRNNNFSLHIKRIIDDFYSA